MVVTGSIPRLFVIGIYAFADFMRGCEIKRSTFYRFDFSCRNRGVINWNEVIGINLTLQFFNSRSRVGNTGQTEETVIGHIDDSCFVGGSLVFDYQFIVVGKRINDIHVQFPGKTFFAVCEDVMQAQCPFVRLLCVPYAGMASGGTTVETIRTIVNRQ